MGSTVSLVAGERVERGPEEEEEVGGGLLWRLQWGFVLRFYQVCHNVNGASGNKKLSNGCWEIRNQPTFSFYDDHSHLLCSRTEHRNTNFRNWDAR